MFSFRAYHLPYFKDLMDLLSCEQVSKDCRCLSHRVEPQDLELDNLAATKMESMTAHRKVHGILAFSNDKVAGWSGIEPMPALVGHDLYEALLGDESDYKMKDDHWGIHCLYVHPDFRGQGLLGQLIKESVSYVTDRGATKILSFGAPDEKYKELPISQRFSGAEKHFAKEGFQSIGKFGATYTLMVREVQSEKPRLSLA